MRTAMVGPIYGSEITRRHQACSKATKTARLRACRCRLSNVWADMHGAAWADFDNDGDQDLFVEVGANYGMGEGANEFLVNTNGNLADKAVDYGLDYALGRGRTPLWLDWDNDGRLDILMSNEERPDGAAPTALFRRLGICSSTAPQARDWPQHSTAMLNWFSCATGSDLPF